MSYTAHQQALIEMGQRLPAVEVALKKEREKVRVLREALERTSFECSDDLSGRAKSFIDAVLGATEGDNRNG